jgi:predicted metal-binding membrane protein
VVNHHILIEGGRFPLLVAGLIFLLAWQLMTVAMMLPSSMPLVRFFLQANATSGGGARATWAFLAGYAAVWTWFAVLAFCGDIMVHTLIHHWTWLAWHPWLIAGGTLLSAGAFQFSPLKGRCLAQCRSPLGFLLRHYRRGTRGAWQLGLRHGRFCLGCCWALMLVMFGLGVGNVLWMAGLAGVMLLEKTSLYGHRLIPLVGAVMLAWGALVVAHPAWLPPLLAGAA